MGKLSAIIRMVLLGTLLSFTQCKRDKPSLPAENLSWNIFLEQATESLKYIKPRWASALGEDQYDSLVQIPCLGQRNRDRQLACSLLEKAQQWPAAKLSPDQLKQQQWLKEITGKIIYELEVNRSHDHDPVLWEIPEALTTCLNRSHLPLAQRLVRSERLTEVFLLYIEKRELDLIHTDSSAIAMARQRNSVSRQILLVHLPDKLRKSNLPAADCSRINQKAAALANRLSDYEDFLNAKYPSVHLSITPDSSLKSDIDIPIPQWETEGRKLFSALIRSVR